MRDSNTEPNPNTAAITLTIPPAHKQALRDIARANHRDLTKELRAMVAARILRSEQKSTNKSSRADRTLRAPRRAAGLPTEEGQR